MKIKSKTLLETALRAKRTFSRGLVPAERKFDGVEIAPFKNDAQATASISADFELNWAWRFLPGAEADAYGAATRQQFPLILSLSKEYGIPITWATVGHLFLSDCQRVHGVPHHDMPRPTSNDQFDGDWYRHDPCTNACEDPFWYAPDLIEKIVTGDVPHEIGTHSFSHIDFSPNASSDELVRREIEECVRVMAPFGAKPSSLVFPRNRKRPSLDLLSAVGITAVRWYDKNISLSYPERTSSGVHKIFQTLSLFAPKRYDLVDRCEITLMNAIERRAAFHFWFHPSDGRDLFENEYRAVLACLAEERDRGTVWIATMREIAAYCEARHFTTLRVQRASDRVLVDIDNRADAEKYGPTELTLILPNTAPPRAARALVRGSHGVEERSILARPITGRGLVVSVPHRAHALELIG